MHEPPEPSDDRPAGSRRGRGVARCAAPGAGRRCRPASRHGTRHPHHLQPQGVHPPHHAVPRPLRLLHIRPAARPTRRPLPPDRRDPRNRPPGSLGRMPRGAVHARRATRGALSGGCRLAGPPRLRIDRRLPGRCLAPGARGDRPAPPLQRRSAPRGRVGPTPGSCPITGDDARDASSRPRLPPGRPRQDTGAPPRHPRGRRPSPDPVHHGHPRRNRRGPH